jgi:hypothetical protein
VCVVCEGRRGAEVTREHNTTHREGPTSAQQRAVDLMVRHWMLGHLYERRRIGACRREYVEEMKVEKDRRRAR